MLYVVLSFGKTEMHVIQPSNVSLVQNLIDQTFLACTCVTYCTGDVHVYGTPGRSYRHLVNRKRSFCQIFVLPDLS